LHQLASVSFAAAVFTPDAVSSWNEEPA
jgi:hypothetical protein